MITDNLTNQFNIWYLSRMRNARPIVKVYAAIDGGGGAGLLADCRTLTAAGCLPLAITTAVTAQNLNGVAACWNLPPARVRAQAAALTAAPAAIKIGVVGAAAAAVATCIRQPPTAPVVWDPVLAPTAGAAFVSPQQLHTLRRTLLPCAHVVTPNRAELLLLSGEQTVANAVAALLHGGARYVLATNINGGGRTVKNVLFGGGAPLWEANSRRRRGDYHGSGCFFSSMLAARLALGDDIIAAATAAQQAVQQAVERAVSLPSLGRQKMLMG